MATPIDRAVTRRCPDITNEDDRALAARLDEEEGGSLHLKWVGLGKSSEHTFSLRELIDFAEGRTGEPESPEAEEEEEPKGPVTAKATDSRRGGISFWEQLRSRLHITPPSGDLDRKDLGRLIALVNELECQEAWLAADSDQEWAEFSADWEKSTNRKVWRGPAE